MSLAFSFQYFSFSFDPIASFQTVTTVIPLIHYATEVVPITLGACPSCPGAQQFRYLFSNSARQVIGPAGAYDILLDLHLIVFHRPAAAARALTCHAFAEVLRRSSLSRRMRDV